MTSLELTLNGRPICPGPVAPNTTLLQYVRSLGLSGSKEGCAEGDCGACTVAVLEPDAAGGPAWRAVNSCLVLLPMVHRRQVLTVEGIGSSVQPHPVQSSLVQALGSQCGYCTPGVIMSMFEACYRSDLTPGAVDPIKLDDQLCGNLCRCTGYRPIREAAAAIAGQCPKDKFQAALSQVDRAPRSLSHEHGGQRFFMPATLAELFELMARHPGLRLVAGGTDLSLEITKQFKTLPLLCSLEAVPELGQIQSVGDRIRIGAGVNLSTLEAFAAGPLPPLERMLRYFGSRQIKNRATVGGNLATASPIGDLPPVLLSLGAEVVLASQAGERKLPLGDFFLGYRKTALGPGEIIAGVELSALPAGDRVRAAAYKVSKRQELDISTVSAGIWVELDAADHIVAARIAFGGMSAQPKRASRTEAALLGRPFLEQSLVDAANELDADYAPIDDHRGSAWYRRTVAKNLLRGFWLETQREPRPRLGYRPTGTVKLGAGTVP